MWSSKSWRQNKEPWDRFSIDFISPFCHQHPAQIRCELLKLRARGVVVKVKDKSFYRVTQKGWTWLWLEITTCSYFKNPIISKNFKKGATQLAEQPSKIEKAYDLIDQGLAQITSELGLVA